MPRPRVSLRRALLALVMLTCLLLFWLNILQVTVFNGSASSNKQTNIGPSAHPSQEAEEDESQEKEKNLLLQSDEKIADEGAENESGPGENNDEHYSKRVEVDKPWFVRGGSRRPLPALKDLQMGRRVSRLFPSESPDDRIPDQLMFIPPDYRPHVEGDDPPKLKKILLPNGLGAWNVKPGREVFNKLSSCPVSTCEITADHGAAMDADAIIYKDHFIPPNVARPKNQVWILYYLECPYHTPNIKNPEVFNWTATYRRDSDIVAPYERWYYYNSQVTQVENMDKNYALNKTKKVAWFVSNCGARNHRLQYAKELKNYIQVDIYGACGTMRCPRYNADRCFEILDKDYKFYLAFENSNCRDYITEKFFVNGLGRNILPIVMGARPEDYEVAAPYNSYIHVDEFESPKELAEYLHRLDKDDELYNSYFKWKGTGEFINTYFWCRVCAMLHDDIQPKNYRDVNEWWRGHGVCTHSSWRRKGAGSSDMDMSENSFGV